MTWEQRESSHLCDCGCGEFTLLAGKTDTRRGHVKGEPLRFLVHHHNRKSEVPYRVDSDTGCWVWQRALSNGYGRITRHGKNQCAHRWYWEQTHGPVPTGLELDHICRNPACVNPDHLRAVSHAQNHQNRSPIGWGSSRFRGVSWSKGMKRWEAYGVLGGRMHRLGYFDNEEEAAGAVSRWRAEHMPFSEERRAA